MTVITVLTVIPAARAFGVLVKSKRSGPVAQLVRASVLHTEGPQFEPVRGHHCSERIPYINAASGIICK